MLMSLQMVMRSPFLLGLSSQTLAKRFHALQAAFPEGNVQRMIEYYPSLLEVNSDPKPPLLLPCGTRRCVEALPYA